jgi:hypothetical protein
VHLKDWEDEFILRVNTGSDASDVPYDCHKHPFDTLPYLKSHIRPQFAIFNAGLKLTVSTRLKSLIINSPDLDFVMDLYEAWTRAPHEECKQDQSYFSPNLPIPSDVDDDDSVEDVVEDKEDSDYVDIPLSKKRKRKASVPPKQKAPAQKTHNAPPKGPRKARGQKVLSVPSRRQLLSEITLYRLEQLGRAGWTRNSIRKWSNYSQKEFKLL